MIATFFSELGLARSRTQRRARSARRPMRSRSTASKRRPVHSARIPSMRVGSIAPSISGTIAPMARPTPRSPFLVWRYSSKVSPVNISDAPRITGMSNSDSSSSTPRGPWNQRPWRREITRSGWNSRTNCGVFWPPKIAATFAPRASNASSKAPVPVVMPSRQPSAKSSRMRGADSRYRPDSRIHWTYSSVDSIRSGASGW